MSTSTYLVTILFLLLPALECALALAINRDEFRKQPINFADLSHRKMFTEHLSTSSYTIAGGALASITFLLNLLSNRPELDGPVLLTWVGFSMLIFSFSLPRISLSNISSILIQEATNFYGFLSFVTGLAFALAYLVPSFTVWIAALPVSLLTLRVVEEYRYLNWLSNEAMKRTDKG